MSRPPAPRRRLFSDRGRKQAEDGRRVTSTQRDRRRAAREE
jgi:hypothetical protein